MPSDVKLEGEKDGYSAAMYHVACFVHRHLSGSDRDVNRLLIERHEAIASLRELCADFGDNDWPDELTLGDIIEKHLARHLYAAKD